MVRYPFMVLAACLTLGLAGPADAGGDPAAGKTKAASCGGCHGKNGEGKKDNPPLAGLAEAAHVKMLQDYKSGARDGKVMQKFAGKLSDQDMADIAAYFASLK